MNMDFFVLLLSAGLLAYSIKKKIKKKIDEISSSLQAKNRSSVGFEMNLYNPEVFKIPKTPNYKSLI